MKTSILKIKPQAEVGAEVDYSFVDKYKEVYEGLINKYQKQLSHYTEYCHPDYQKLCTRLKKELLFWMAEHQKLCREQEIYNVPELNEELLKDEAYLHDQSMEYKRIHLTDGKWKE